MLKLNKKLINENFTSWWWACCHQNVNVCKYTNTQFEVLIIPWYIISSRNLNCRFRDWYYINVYSLILKNQGLDTFDFYASYNLLNLPDIDIYFLLLKFTSRWMVLWFLHSSWVSRRAMRRPGTGNSRVFKYAILWTWKKSEEIWVSFSLPR